MPSQQHRLSVRRKNGKVSVTEAARLYYLLQLLAEQATGPAAVLLRSIAGPSRKSHTAYRYFGMQHYLSRSRSWDCALSWALDMVTGPMQTGPLQQNITLTTDTVGLCFAENTSSYWHIIWYCEVRLHIRTSGEALTESLCIVCSRYWSKKLQEFPKRTASIQVTRALVGSCSSRE